MNEFIEKVKDGAIRGWKVNKVLPSITIAQAILESGWGKSELATKANNLFGIKAKEDWNGEKYKVKTAEYDKYNRKFFIDAYFRKYNNWSESILDHAKFFTSTPWRRENYKKFIGEKDYIKAAKALQSAGYATSQIYAKQLIELISKYNLDKYDDVIKGGNNMRIFLSVGHSILKDGTCTSASGYINEYQYNKALAPYIKKELEKLGHSCDVIIVPERKYTTKQGEYSYKIPIANSGKYDLVCELHLNASNGAGRGSEVYYYSGDAKGKKIANQICANLSKLGFLNRGAKTAQLYMINDTRPTSVLVESFFCDNKGDSDLAKRVGYENMAKAIASGLVGNSNISASSKTNDDGWKRVKNKWQYYKNAKLYAGWIEDRGKWYWVDPKDYNMVTGWKEIRGKWYYFKADGEMTVGWLWYNGHKFYFDKKGVMVRDCTLRIDGKEYKFDKNGYLIK